jgi:ectoine hydroxylase-related dioxygenase (phytanoyl-CoA dioxygenase family)
VSLETSFYQSGYALREGLVAPEDLAALRNEVDRLLAESDLRGGVRNALAKSPRLRGLAESEALAGPARELLGEAARPVKLTIFDKTPGSSWKVPWHQDVTIPVREHLNVAGFGPWSVKDGVLHVQAPTAVLEQVLAVRVHLDGAAADNGALRVLPGTHRLGRLSGDEIAALRRELPETVCPVPAGGAMLMSPLLVHASSGSERPSHRRVLHFEYCAAPLPGGLAWAE